MKTLRRRPTPPLPPTPPPLLPPVERIVASVRAAWRLSTGVHALVLGPALFALCAVLLVAGDLLVPLPAAWREALRWLPFALGGAILAVAGVRLARPPAPRRFALLAEERLPGLDNRLITAFDVALGDPDSLVARAFVADAERRLSGLDVRGVAPVRPGVPLVILAASWAVALAFAVAFPGAAREAWSRWLHPRDAYAQRWSEVRASTLPTLPTPPVPGFDELRWRIHPPAYAGLGESEGRGEEPLQALAGSRVSLRSAFFSRWDAVRASRIGGGALPVLRRGQEWTVEWTQGAAERGISLEAIASGEVVARQVLPLTVMTDRAPDVELSAPEADLVLASGHGRVPIRASARDDYGVAAFDLAWSRTRGSGETFTYLEGRWNFASLRRDGRGVNGELPLDLDALQLEPGDVIHVRAVARDGNNVTGPGESVSRTRIIRVARPGEMDEINTDVGFPMELPKDPLLSQRMLIIQTERLLRDRPTLSDADFRARSARIASDQGRLRDRVGEQIFTRSTGGLQDPTIERSFSDEGGIGHPEADAAPAPAAPAGAPAPSFSEQVLAAASAATGQGTIDEVTHHHDSDPILDVNQTLLGLYNLMWAAERELNQAAPQTALPSQREALLVIDRLRRTERVYPSANLRIDPVNVDSARGQGKVEDARPAARGGGNALPNTQALLEEMDRVSGAAAGLPPRSLALRLSALAARALAGDAPDAVTASLLSRAASEAQAGRAVNARVLLVRARARIAPAAAGRVPTLPAPGDPAAAEYYRRLGRTP